MGKNKTVAALLAIFFGTLGVHKFYLNRSSAGVFYIFLTFVMYNVYRLPISFFLSIIDAIRLFSMSEEEFDNKYNRYVRKRHSRRSNRRPDFSKKSRETYQYKPNKRQRKNPFQQSGEKKYQDFDLEEALKDFEQALVISPDDGSIHFRMAGIYSMLENKDKSYFHLQRAKECGFNNLQSVDDKDDFAFIRIQDDYEAFKEAGFKLIEKPSLEAPKEDLLQDDLLLSQLNKLKKLREKGLLSEKEFLYEKEKLLKR